MSKKSNKRNKRQTKGKTTRKQKPIMMIGCSKKNKKSCKKNGLSILGNTSCPNCGPNCHCGSNCKCVHPCPGNCYLNRRVKNHKGGSGCGSCGCPLASLSWNQMNKFGGNINSDNPVIISPPQKGYQPIDGISQKGGTCSSCLQQSGGNFFKQIGAMPGTNVGSYWGQNINQWPGVDGIGSNRNSLAQYDTNKNVQLQMSMNDSGYKTPNSMVGGYTYKNKLGSLKNRNSNRNSDSSSNSNSNSNSSSTSKSKKGGALIPQDLVNLGRDFTYNFKSAYNALNGYKAPVDPSPYKGQLTGTLNTNKFFKT